MNYEQSNIYISWVDSLPKQYSLALYHFSEYFLFFVNKYNISFFFFFD